MQFNDQHCFLCGTTITKEQRTPVFGTWLQQKYDLQNKEILMLDKSVTTFSNLTIPCCDTCQVQHIIPLEKDIQQASEKGSTGLKGLDPKRLFQWIGKMYYGILVIELINETNPLIMPEHAVSENPQMQGKSRALFQVLQSLRVPMVYSDFLPCSLFILDVNDAEDELPFEYQDELSTMAFSIKLDKAVIVCTLLDNGIIKKALNKLYSVVQDKPLHPVQVAEFKARVFYAAYIFNVVPDYFIRPIKPGDQQVVLDTLIDDVTNDVFNPFEVMAYAHMLEEMLKPWGIREKEILQDSGKPVSFIINDNGTFNIMEKFLR